MAPEALRVGSLFTGIGGFDLGFERAGMRIEWQLENDEFCRCILARHWPWTLCFGSIGRVKPSLPYIPRVDVLCGGFPCQPVSWIGRGGAQQSEKWLWPEFANFIRHLRPRYVVVENVPGLLARGMGDVLGDLADMGYDAEWRCLSAWEFGAPHFRDRVWIVAYPHRECDDQRDPQIFPRGASPELCDWWESEPDVGRVADGVPAQVDRLRSLGNALLPQIAEWLGRRIIADDQAQRRLRGVSGEGVDEHGPPHGRSPAGSDWESLQDSFG